jgi:hypothetical protein
MLPANENIPIAIVVVNSIFHTLGVIAVTRDIDFKTEVVCEREDGLVGADAFPVCGIKQSVRNRAPRGATRGRTILRRHRHNIPDIISRIRTKDLPETLRAEARAIVFGLLAVSDEIYSWFRGGERAER